MPVGVSRPWGSLAPHITVEYTDKEIAEITGVEGATFPYQGEPQKGYTGTPTSAFTGTYKILYTGRDGTEYAQSTTAPTDVGEYTVTFQVPSTDAKYIGDTFVNFTISPAPVVVTAKNRMAYVGDTAPDLDNPTEGTDYTVTGLVGSDTLKTAPKMEYDVTPDMTISGTYSIIPFDAEVTDNYTIEFQNGTLTVSEKPTAETAVAAPAATAVPVVVPAVPAATHLLLSPTRMAPPPQPPLIKPPVR
jgi:hypothetical protein